MSLKDRVLSMLYEKRGSYVSGEEIGSKIHITRAAVWKAVSVLRSQGYKIESSTKKGYLLSDEADIFTPQSVALLLENPACVRIVKYDAVPSTNLTAKEFAAKGEPEGLVVLAEEQSRGRGRFGRSFYSPGAGGVYMSILLRPACPVSDSLFLTTAAAAAVAQAIEKLSGRKALIKWVNDVLTDGKKVCGILTEAALTLESGGVDYAVVGIGVNVFKPENGFPAELADIAGAVFDSGKPAAGVRSALAAEIINNFMRYYKELEKRTFYSEYKKRSVVIGREVTVLQNGEETRARVLDLDKDCRLIVRYGNGTQAVLSSGEISIKL